MHRFSSWLVAVAFAVSACSSSDGTTGTNTDADHADGTAQDSATNETSTADSSTSDSSTSDTNGSDTSSGDGSTADGDASDPCTAGGGTVGTALCCSSASDFPNNCLTGACGCSPSSSHEIKVCNCPTPDCWDGTKCTTPPG